MTTAAHVWDLLRTQVTPRGTTRIPLSEADGRTLREPVRAPEDMPAFDRSAVDGFAVLSGDASLSFAVSGEIRAGDSGVVEWSDSCAYRIATGGAVPTGAEVIMLEDAVEKDGRVSFLRRGRNHIRRRGEDAKSGEEIVPSGSRLSDGCIALLASVGCTRPVVTRPVSAHHIATGNEIVDPSSEPQPGQIRDANSSLVRAWAHQCGLVFSQRRVNEDEKALRDAITRDCDLLLVSGGASVGKHDFTGKVLRDAGFEILVEKVNARPGKPLIVARREDQWAFGLPGNPLSHFVCLHVFVAAAIAPMEGSAAAPVLLNGRVIAPIGGNPRETWWLAREEGAGLRPLRWTSSGDMTAMASANALIRVPVSGLAAGDPAEFIRTT